jgi:hypothetical protein
MMKRIPKPVAEKLSKPGGKTAPKPPKIAAKTTKLKGSSHAD